MHTGHTATPSYTDSTRRVAGKICLLALLVVLVPALTSALGPAPVSVHELVGVTADHLGLPVHVSWDAVTDAIVWDTRLPRIVAGVGVGAVLGAAGVALQTIVRNPLAEPYVLGVSSGASAGAATAMIVLATSSSLGVGVCAFIGALLATFLVLALGGRGSGTALTLILAGLAVGFAFQSVTNLIIFAAKTPESSRAALFWTLGSLGRVGWVNAVIGVATAVALCLVLVVVSPLLDALAFGDRTSITVGVRPGLARTLLLIPVSGAVALAVAIAGGIGFVGLVIPHLMRAWVGPRHGPLLIASALGGAVFLTAADTVSRIGFAPTELPLGVVTGLVGAPFLMYLVKAMSS